MRFMAERAGSTTVEIDASHAVTVSQPDAVADLIDTAARATATDVAHHGHHRLTPSVQRPPHACHPPRPSVRNPRMPATTPVRTFGGPTALFEYGGLRFLTDPTFDAPGDYPAGRPAPDQDRPLLRPPRRARPHRRGPALPRRAPRQPRPLRPGPARRRPAHPHHPRRRAAPRRQGARGLADWESRRAGPPGRRHDDRHRRARRPRPGTREEVEAITGQVVGFVLTGEGLPTVYVSGDNASLDLVKEIAERFGPVDTAILFAGAPRIPGLFDGALIVLDSAAGRRGRRDPRRPPGGSRPLRQLGALHRGPRRAGRRLHRRRAWPPAPGPRQTGA